MMVLSGLLKPTPRQPARASTHNAAGSNNSTPGPAEPSPSPSPLPDPLPDPLECPYIREQEHLLPIESDDPDLRDLNNSLAALAAIFPDVQVEVFREMLASFDGESRLAVATEALLKEKMKWVNGRYRISKKTDEAERDIPDQPDPKSLVTTEEMFRSDAYKKSVKNIAYHEFKGLPRSTINAVLAEFNHSYTLARPTLVALSSKSWRFSLSSLFLRRKTVSSQELEQHPLITWQSTGKGSIVPTLKPTGSPELDRELFHTIILPIQKRQAAKLEEEDREVAVKLNNSEAEANEALHDCQCCFTSTTFEDLSACNDGAHIICFRCVRHAINEAVFGQGWQRNIDPESGTLRCVAATSEECKGYIPQELVRRAFAEEKNGKEVLRKVDERLASDSLLKSNLRLIQCPFCSYAEVDELYLPESQRLWQTKPLTALSFLYIAGCLTLGARTIPFLLPTLLMLSLILLILSSKYVFGAVALEHINSSVNRLRRKRRGLKFACQNDTCRLPSCMSCSKAWTDIHICHESSLLALRTQVELAMSLAIKRTCPRCNTSFVKSSGCNKLTCVCGYQMCYICRKDIGGGEGYRHFCEHFRPNAERACSDCSKCDLYRCENETVVVERAKKEAEMQWMEKEGAALNDEEARKVLEERLRTGNRAYLWERGVLRQWKMLTWEKFFDAVVDCIIE